MLCGGINYHSEKQYEANILCTEINYISFVFILQIATTIGSLLKIKMTLNFLKRSIFKKSLWCEEQEILWMESIFQNDLLLYQTNCHQILHHSISSKGAEPKKFNIHITDVGFDAYLKKKLEKMVTSPANSSLIDQNYDLHIFTSYTETNDTRNRSDTIFTRYSEFFFEFRLLYYFHRIFFHRIF